MPPRRVTAPRHPMSLPTSTPSFLISEHIAPSLFGHWKEIFLQNYEAQLLDYVAIAGTSFVVFYGVFRRLPWGRKIQATFPRSADVLREILFSLASLGIFAAVGVFSVTLKRLGWTQLYYQIDQHGPTYFIFSVVALIILQDSWFYWTHRWLHWRPLFRLVHSLHHRSHNPSPWAAFSFHPVEALIQALVYPLVILFLPVHPLAVAIWLLYMTAMNVGGHLGFELFPKGFVRHWLFRWHNTSVHHNMHHSDIHFNYGLYFNLWDRIMGTNHPDYEQCFDRLFHSRATHPKRSQTEAFPCEIRERS